MTLCVTRAFHAFRPEGFKARVADVAMIEAQLCVRVAPPLGKRARNGLI